LEGCTPTTTEQVVNDKNPKVFVRELIDTIQANACELPEQVLFDSVLSWIENPEGVFDGDYDKFESAAQNLGFSVFPATKSIFSWLRVFRTTR
jgi:hypothetical protein